MIWRNTAQRFGAVHKSLHWTMGFIIIGLICVGLYMTRADLPISQRIQVVSLHKSFGILILTLAVLRVLWRFSNMRPGHLPTHKTWEVMLAKAAHFLLYAAMFAMPLSGWMMTSAKGYPVQVFGFFNLPHLVAANEDLGNILETAHKWTGYALIVLIGLHVAGALKHHVIDRDDTLRRMIPFGKLKNTEDR